MRAPPDSYPNEDRRWMLVLGIPMLGACIFMATAIGTSIHWLIAFCLAFGPVVGVVSLIYLAISSDTNSDSAPTGTAPRASVATGATSLGIRTTMTERTGAAGGSNMCRARQSGV